MVQGISIKEPVSDAIPARTRGNAATAKSEAAFFRSFGVVGRFPG
jgi:hypothetical protein